VLKNSIVYRNTRKRGKFTAFISLVARRHVHKPEAGIEVGKGHFFLQNREKQNSSQQLPAIRTEDGAMMIT
jgi:hypothetical protein